jgi:aminotransferase
MPQPSDHIQALGDALSIRWNNRVYEMQARGQDVTVLSLGEAFFDIPISGLDHVPGGLHYSHSRGVPKLRQAIADDYHGIAIDADTEVLVTAGSKIAIYMALLTMIDPGDEVLIPEPAWVSYTEQARLCNAVPVTIPYDVDCAGWEQYVTDRTRVLIVNSPNNPRGNMLTEQEWQLLHDLARRRGLYLLCDEAYSHFLPEGKQFVSGLAGDADKHHTVVCNSLSKNVGMSGWRIGYALASSSFLDQLLKAQQHLVTCAATPLSVYAADHYRELREVVAPQIAAVVARRAEIVTHLDRLGIGHLPGDCTFYVFVSTGASALDSEAFCGRLLDEHRVAAVPGIGYGASCDKFIRVSVGTESLDRTVAALKRVRALIDETATVRSAA